MRSVHPATPQPQRRDARLSLLFPCRIERRRMQPHFDFSTQSSQFRRRRTRWQPRTNIGIQQASRVDGSGIGARKAAQQEATLAGIVQRVFRPEGARKFRAPGRPFCGIQAQQTTIHEAYMVEPGLEVHGRREPGGSCRARFEQSLRAALRDRQSGQRHLFQFTGQPRPPLWNRLRPFGEAQQIVEGRQRAWAAATASGRPPPPAGTGRRGSA